MTIPPEASSLSPSPILFHAGGVALVDGLLHLCALALRGLGAAGAAPATSAAGAARDQGRCGPPVCGAAGVVWMRRTARLPESATQMLPSGAAASASGAAN